MTVVVICLAIGGVLLVIYALTYNQDTDTRENALAKKYSSQMGRFAAVKEHGAAIERTGLLTTLDMEHQLTNQIDSRYKNNVVADINRETQAQELELRQRLIKKASATGVDVASYLEVEKKKQFNQADLDSKLAEMREQVRLAIIAKHLSEMQKVTLVQELIDGINKQMEQIKADRSLSEGTRRRMLDDRREIRTAFKETRRGIEKRLLEAHNGGNV
jgi:hypothetical protein